MAMLSHAIAASPCMMRRAAAMLRRLRRLPVLRLPGVVWRLTGYVLCCAGWLTGPVLPCCEWSSCLRPGLRGLLGRANVPHEALDVLLLSDCEDAGEALRWVHSPELICKPAPIIVTPS